MPGSLRSISIRSIVTFVTLVAFIATSLLVYLTYVNVSDFDRAHRELARNATRSMLAEQAYREYLKAQGSVAGLRVEYSSRLDADLTNATVAANEALEGLLSISSTPAESAAIALALAGHQRVSDAWLTYSRMRLRGIPSEEADATLIAAYTDADALGRRLDSLVRETDEALQQAQVEAMSTDGSRNGMLLGLGAMIVSIALFSGLVYHRLVVVPVRRVSEAARAIADGDTEYVAPVCGPREVAQLGVDVNAMTVSLMRRSNELSAYLSKNLESRTEELEGLNRALLRAHSELADSQLALQEKSRLLEAALEAERDLARHDALTGALNHGAIVEHARELARPDGRGRPFGLAIIDIDSMKAVNDLYGHPFGDGVLRAVKEALSVHDAVVGRYGGDEFVAVLPTWMPSLAETYREAVMAALTKADLRDPETNMPVPVVVSIGVASYPEDGTTVDALIDVADERMYEDKWSRLPGLGAEGSATRTSGERAARVLGQVVPLLLADAPLASKLARFCESLARFCGFDVVDMVLKPGPASEHQAMSTYPTVAEDLYEFWVANRRASLTTHTLRSALERERRPILLDDPQNDKRLAPFQRDFARKARLRTLMLVPVFNGTDLIGSIAVGSRRQAAFSPPEAQLVIEVADQVGAIVALLHQVEALTVEQAPRSRAAGDSDAAA